MLAQMQGFLIRGLPVIKEGDDLASLIESLFELQDGDVLCIASTVVAKSEGRFRDLEDYSPGPRAKEIAEALGKDPRFVQAVLDESEEVLLDKPFLGRVPGSLKTDNNRLCKGSKEIQQQAIDYTAFFQ